MSNLYLLLIVLILILIIILLLMRIYKLKWAFYTILVFITILLLFEISLIFGEQNNNNINIVESRIIKELNSKYLGTNDTSKVSYKYKDINNLIKNLSYFEPQMNKITVLENGQDTYSSLFNRVNNAKEYIHIEDFILRDDRIGEKFIDLLINKAKEGVEVKLIIDGFGINIKRAKLKEMKDSGVDIIISKPKVYSALTGNLNNRDHRKIFIIDGRVAFTGGINIGDEYLGKNPEVGYWRDTDVMIEGSCVKQLEIIFIANWMINKGSNLNIDKYFGRKDAVSDQLCQVVSGSSVDGINSIEYLYISLINSAQKSILISTPYLVLNKNTYQAIMSAYLRGVDIRIIVPPYADNKTIYKCTKTFADELSRKGIAVYKYNKGFIHSKRMVIDNDIAVVGTANFNNRSTGLDYENILVLYDQKAVADILKGLNSDLNDSSMNISNNKRSIIDDIFLFISPVF